MAVTSVVSDGGDSNRKPKQAQNVNKKLKQLVSSSLPIPDEVTEICLAFIRRCHYPTLALVSSSFRRLIASPKIYDTRSRLACTEPVLYASVGILPFENPSLYILHRKTYRNTVLMRLGKIDSLPSMPWGSAVVTIGSEIYVFGGCVGQNRTSDVTLVDCRSHTHRSLPRMKVARCRAAAGVIDGKIYVIGGCEMQSSDWVEVFDLKEETWISSIPQQSWDLPIVSREFVSYVVMEEKLYLLDDLRCYVFEPQHGKCESLGANTLHRLWKESSCVIDDMLFSIGTQQSFLHIVGHPIYVYDPKVKIWRPLRGLEGFPANIILKESKMANFGGKLVVMGADVSRYSTKYNGKREVLYVEIALERREGGEIWGKVESVAVVLTVPKLPSVELCRTVTV